VLPELAEKLVPGNRLALRVRPSFPAFASGGIEVAQRLHAPRVA